MWAARFSGLALPNSFLTFFHVRPASRKTRRSPLREIMRPKARQTHSLSFFTVQLCPGKPWLLGSVFSTISTSC